MVKFIETENGMVFSRVWGSSEGKRELWLNRYSVSELARGENSGDWLHNNVSTLQTTGLYTWKWLRW